MLGHFSQVWLSAMVGLWLARRRSHFRKASRFSMVKSRSSTPWLTKLSLKPRLRPRPGSWINLSISVGRRKTTYTSSIRRSGCWRTGFNFPISPRQSVYLRSRLGRASRCVRGGFVPVRTWSSLRRYSRRRAARVLPKSRLSRSYFKPTGLRRLQIRIRLRTSPLLNLSAERRTSIALRGSTALVGSLAADSMSGESRSADRVRFITDCGAPKLAFYRLSAIKIKFFSIWTRPEKNATRTRQNDQYGPKIEEIPPHAAKCGALTRQLEAAIRGEKGLVSDAERDAAAACHGVPSSRHGKVNQYPHIASAHAKRTIESKYANARSLANG